MSAGVCTRPDVLVAGGGLAGLAAGITAARCGLRVLVVEAGRIGRDKVCGELLSPEAAADLIALGGVDALARLEPVPVQSLLVTEPRGALLRLDLPGAPGLCLTRATLEAWLKRQAIAAGVDVLERTTLRDLDPRDGELLFRAGQLSGSATALVVALGKRSSLDAALGLPRAHQPAPFGAAKVYFRAPRRALAADVEVHLLEGGGYVGLNPVERGRFGLCALLSGPPPRSWALLRAHLVERGSAALGHSLGCLGEPEGAPRTLQQFGVGAQAIVRRLPGGVPALFTGDSARMMPAYTGDGMAVALRSGRLAAAALLNEDPIAAYEHAYRDAFRVRTACASVIHQAFLRPPLFRAIAPFVSLSPSVAERVFGWTHGLPAEQAAA
jgi:flavin-dependent dehydrogenase